MKEHESQTAGGFNAVEFLVVGAIVIFFLLISALTYLHYDRKTYFNEVVHTASQYKTYVEKCLKQQQGILKNCTAGNHGVPPNRNNVSEHIASIVVSSGVITVTPKPGHGIKHTDNYILTPRYSPQEISWTASGGACLSNLISC